MDWSTFILIILSVFTAFTLERITKAFNIWYRHKYLEPKCLPKTWNSRWLGIWFYFSIALVLGLILAILEKMLVCTIVIISISVVLSSLVCIKLLNKQHKIQRGK